MAKRKYNRVYDWETARALPKTDYDDMPALTELQQEWCLHVRLHDQQRTHRLVQAAGSFDCFPGALTVIVDPATDIDKPSRDFPNVALAASPHSRIEVVYVKKPWTT